MKLFIQRMKKYRKKLRNNNQKNEIKEIVNKSNKQKESIGR